MNPGGNQIGVGGRLAEKRIEIDRWVYETRHPDGPGGSECTNEEFLRGMPIFYGDGTSNDEGALQVMSDGAVLIEFVRGGAASNQGLRGDRNRERLSALHHRYNGKEVKR